MRKRPAIPRLDGGSQTILLVEDVERSVAFYGKSLLLEAKDGDTDRYAEFETGDGGVLVIIRREGSIAPMITPGIAEEGASLVFTITPEAIELWKKWFAKCGVPIDGETKWIHGGRSLYVRDPDGRRLEFKTPPSEVMPAPTVLSAKKRED